MKLTKPEDSAAKAIRFGVELETVIPTTSGVEIGDRHHGRPVVNGLVGHCLIDAPQFGNARWRAERDGSIRYDANYAPCEFVSPILHGEAGVAALRKMIEFIRGIGGKVNDSCGCHITVGIGSIIGVNDPTPHQIAEFCQRVAHIAQSHAWAIFAQTGTGRHVNSFSHALSDEVGGLLKQMKRHAADGVRVSSLAYSCGRGMVNFQKAFTHGCIEFRAFAGTLNESKVLHHLATVLGLCRRAATVQRFGRFNRKATKKHSRVANAVEALRRMWRLLGWVDSVPNRDCALGMFGALHSEFGAYRAVAVEMAQQFESRFPAANL